MTYEFIYNNLRSCYERENVTRDIDEDLKILGNWLFKYRVNNKYEKPNKELCEIIQNLSGIFSLKNSEINAIDRDYAEYCIGVYLVSLLVDITKANPKTIILDKVFSFKKKDHYNYRGTYYIPKRSLWFAGKIILAKGSTFAESLFKKLDKIKKDNTFGYAILVNIYASYNNDLLKNSDIFRIGKVFKELLIKYGFNNKTEVAKELLHGIKLNRIYCDCNKIIIRQLENGKYYILNYKESGLMDLNEVLYYIKPNEVLNAKNKKPFEDAVYEEKEVNNCIKAKKHSENLASAIELYLDLFEILGYISPGIAIIANAIEMFCLQLPMINNIMENITQIKQPILKVLSKTGFGMGMALINCIVVSLTFTIIYFLGVLIYMLITKLKIKQSTKAFSKRYGCEIFFERKQNLDNFWNVKFLKDKL